MTSEHRDELELETESEFELESMNFDLDQIVESVVSWASSPISPNLEPMIPPSVKLKALPKHLKYVYLREQETLPVIITSNLTVGHEERLILVLRKHKKVIGWIMTDIKELSLAIIQHHIHLNEETTPKRDPQCRLNPIMQDAFRTEILKLLNNGIIYPISDNQ